MLTIKFVVSKMNLDSVKQKEFFPGLKGKLIHGDKITWAFWDVEKDAEVPEHFHHHEQIMHVVDGEFEFILDGKKIRRDYENKSKYISSKIVMKYIQLMNLVKSFKEIQN